MALLHKKAFTVRRKIVFEPKIADKGVNKRRDWKIIHIGDTVGAPWGTRPVGQPLDRPFPACIYRTSDGYFYKCLEIYYEPNLFLSICFATIGIDFVYMTEQYQANIFRFDNKPFGCSRYNT